MSCERSEGSETLHFRYIELTEEDKEKLKGSYKVAKKLEKLESRDKNGDSEEDDDYDCDPGEYPSLDSFTSNVSDPSPASPETSLSPRPTSSPRSGPSPGITNTGNHRQSENIEIMHHDNTQSHSWFQQPPTNTTETARVYFIKSRVCHISVVVWCVVCGVLWSQGRRGITGLAD